MKHGEYYLECALAIPWHEVDRDAATIVVNSDRTVTVDGHQDEVAETGESFVYGVVHDLVDKMVQSTAIRAADIHGRALAYRSQAFQYRDVGGIVGLSHP